MRTRREQMIEAVAGIILEGGWEEDADRCIAQNAGDGWGFKLRWDDTEYVSLEDYTRVEYAQLAPYELNAALALAREWKANPDAL